MLWKYCGRSIFFLIPPHISATIILFYFFPPIFGNAIVTIAIKKKNWFPYFGNGIATIRFSQFFFLPSFDNAIATIVTKKKISPYFGNGIATISLSIFFFLFTSGTPCTLAAELGTGNSVSLLPKFNIFSLHLFLLLSHTFGWISAMVIPKFNLSPQNPK